MRHANLIRSLLLAIALLPAASPAQSAKAAGEASAAARRPLTPRTDAPTQLPVTRVALYKNGVGFFEHSGHVTGSQSVTIDFTTAQLNDVLQSLTAIDLNGGRIAGAGYNSTTPLEQQLKALPLALGEDPTAVDFYNAIRGARVEVHSAAATNGVAISGRLLNIELINTTGKDGEAVQQKRLITVVAESGEIRTLELTPATEVRLLDADLHQDVTRYLQLLASTRNQGLRHLTLLDNGTGTRELHVSYISEVPIWKSTYRILFTDHKSAATTPAPVQTATLQGWSVVDNTTGSDWNNVQLSLIAGAPQSFIQPLSIPYYSRRPEIPLPQEAQLTPQTHESGEEKSAAGLEGNEAYANGFTGGQLPRAAASQPSAVMLGRASGIGSGSGGAFGGVMGGVGASPAPPPPHSENMSYQESAYNSLAPNTTTAAFDDYFAYNLADPITIRKNESAMVPILQTKIDAERVTLWSPRQPTPLRALWITNTSQLTLDRGSFSIVEDGNFGGEGLLDPIHPGEKRLLSYAVDQAVAISSTSGSVHNLRSVIIAKGVLVSHYRDIDTRDYAIRNAAAEPRTVVIEHNITTGAEWLLNPATSLVVGKDSTPIQPDEKLPTLYRFRVPVAPGATVHLKVAESHAYPREIQVGNIGDQQVKILLQDLHENAADNPDLLKQLQPVLDAQRKIADLNAQKKAADAELTSLHQEEDRQRANITALKDADRTARQRFVNDLGHTEDQIALEQKSQRQLDAQLASAHQALADLAQQLQFDQTVTPTP